ncbi:MAG: restriction endonuclease subunit S [Desulfuromonadales bacterium]|nr:restriction endonuclease subunit S [Desulfuromonadales bacterium]
MAVCSSISISHVEYLRFDADFYHPKYLQELETWRTLDERIGVSKLSHLISAPVRTGRTPSSRHIKEEDEIISFIKTDGIREGRINFDSAGELPKRVLNGTDFIPADSVVVTIIGATPEIVGRAAIIRDADPRCVTNQNVAVITTNSKCDPYFLTAYFQTSFGRDQLWRHSRRTEQVNLNCREVERVLVPTPDISLQNEIGNMVRASFAATDDSESLYTQAQQLLESKLELDKLRFDKPVGYTARFSVVGLSDSVSANRIDAQCFSPEAVFYEDWLLKHANCDRLSLLLSSTAKGRQQVEAETGTTDYCSIKHITGREIVGASKAYVVAGTSIAKKDDLLLAITGATIGKIGIVNRYDNLIFSGDMLRLRANGSVNPHYLLLTLDHHLGQVQFNRWITGSTNGHLAPRDVGRVLVPRLAPEQEEQIAALVAESLEKRQESEHLLDQAKSRVEQLIEEAVRA